MKRETYNVIVSQFDSDPAKWYEVLKALLLEMVNESEQRSERRKNAPKKQGSTKKTKSETSTTTTQKVEVKEKSEFDKTIDAFIEMRKTIKKPLTKDWLKLIKDKLEKMYPWNIELQIKVLNNSISNSWQWVFPLKDGEQTETKSKYNPFEDLSWLTPR